MRFVIYLFYNNYITKTFCYIFPFCYTFCYAVFGLFKPKISLI